MQTSPTLSFGQRLRRERLHRGLTQEQLAKPLKTTKLSITRWENGPTIPHPTMQQTIYNFFGKTAETFGIFQAQVWHVPFERNPFFRGRDEMLTALYKALTNGGSVAITQHALSGIGGIGKTQTAVEYAHRFGHEYQAVLWVRAETRETLTTDFVQLATLLDLRDKNTIHQFLIIQAVKAWLQEQSSWLLIFDNVEDITLLSEFLPTRRNGSVLITTRYRIRGKYIKNLDVEKLSKEESLLLLLKRAKLIEDEHLVDALAEDERQAANQLCEHLDGLPLALDQAAAYIEENTCSVADYLLLFQQHRSLLLAWSSHHPDYPYSVATTWQLSFQKMEENHPAAADLLRLCAFLHPDAIPLEFFIEVAAYLGPHLQSMADNAVALNAAIQPLIAFSLVKRDNKARTLTIHRLVQAVLQDQMDEQTYQIWAKHAIQAVNAVFPESDFAQWPRCDLYLSHALLCTTFIEQKDIIIPEAATLLNRVGAYMRERARFKEAIPILQLAVKLSEQLFGIEHLNTATALHNLAATHRELVQHDIAQPLYERALAIRQQHLGLYHLDVASTIRELADLYQEKELYEQSEQYYQQAIKIYEQTNNTEHPDMLRSLYELAATYFRADRWQDAEPLWQRVYTIRKRTLGSNHPDIARSLNSLAILKYKQEQFEEAEQLFWAAFDIVEKQMGAYHRTTATSLHNIASLYKEQKRYKEADTLWRRALAIRKRTLGLDHVDTQNILRLLRELYEEQGLGTQIDALMAELQAPEPDNVPDIQASN